MAQIVRAYYYLYVRLCRFFKRIANDDWQEEKALVVVCLLQAAIIFIGLIWLDILTEWSFPDIGKTPVFAIGVAIFAFNVFLVSRKKSVQQASEVIAGETEQQRVSRGAGVVAAILVALTILVTSFIAFSNARL